MDDDAPDHAPGGARDGAHAGAVPPIAGTACEPVCPEPAGPDPRGIDWANVWHDFVYSGEALKRIAWKHGTTARTIRKRVHANGWVRIVPMRPRAIGRKPGPRSGEPPTLSERRRASLIKRLFKMLDATMGEIEARMKSGDTRSAADTERDARAISTIMQFYAKLVALDEANAKKGSQDAAKGTGHDAEQLRRDLADRLARLRRGGDV